MLFMRTCPAKGGSLDQNSVQNGFAKMGRMKNHIAHCAIATAVETGWRAASSNIVASLPPFTSVVQMYGLQHV